MAIPVVIRGATVTLQVTFKDADGVVVHPPGAKAVLCYSKNGALVEVDFDLQESSDTWSVDWDSRVSDGCRVTWTAYTTGLAQVASVDAAFDVVANNANLRVTA